MPKLKVKWAFSYVGTKNGEPVVFGDRVFVDSMSGKVYSLVSANEGWRQVGGAYQSVASPVGSMDGIVYFADPAANRIYKSDSDGKVTVFKENSGGSAALATASEGRLYSAQPAGKRIVVYSATGEVTTVAQNVEASSLAVSASGNIYFIDAARKSVAWWIHQARCALFTKAMTSRSLVPTICATSNIERAV